MKATESEKREGVEDSNAAEELADNWEDFYDELSGDEQEKKNDQTKIKLPEVEKKETLGDKKDKKKKNLYKNEDDIDTKNKYSETHKAEMRSMHADAAVADDLFDGCDRPDDYVAITDLNNGMMNKKKDKSGASEDIFKSSNLNLLKDVERFALHVFYTVIPGTAKSIAWLRFLTILLRESSPKMDTKDLGTLSNKISRYIQNIRTVSQQKNDIASNDGVGGDSTITLNTLKDVEAYAEAIAVKIREGPVKSVCFLRLYDKVLAAVVPKMDSKDLTTYFNVILATVEAICLSQRASQVHKRKPNTVASLQKSYKDEMDLIYGDISDSEASLDGSGPDMEDFVPSEDDAEASVHTDDKKKQDSVPSSDNSETSLYECDSEIEDCVPSKANLLE